MYRIKAPKGDSGYWVPIFANPDIVEHYSENVVDLAQEESTASRRRSIPNDSYAQNIP